MNMHPFRISNKVLFIAGLYLESGQKCKNLKVIIQAENTFSYSEVYFSSLSKYNKILTECINSKYVMSFPWYYKKCGIHVKKQCPHCTVQVYMPIGVKEDNSIGVGIMH